jgi:glycerophosphoryl diester phosphodiesterase
MGGRSAPLVVAHRGSRLRAPENTMAAFRLAAAEGADMVELDCRAARDGSLVVIHDATLRRTAGIRSRVRDLPGAALAAIDVGSSFSHRFEGEPIPLLEEVFRRLPLRVGVNIEVKTDPLRPRRNLIARRLRSLLRARAHDRTVVVSSFDHRFLAELHRRAPSITLGALQLPLRDSRRRPSSYRRRFGASWYICSVAQLRTRMAEEARLHGMTVACYTVNTAAQLRRALEAGVDAVITDDPAGVGARLRS